MPHEDQYMERTPDLVARIRKLREEAEEKMNRFTRVADYDVRHVIGQKTAAEPSAMQTAMEFSPDITEQGEEGEVHQ